MITKQQKNALESMRDQRLDVKLGTISPQAWIKSLDSINLAPSEIPTDLQAFRAECAIERGTVVHVGRSANAWRYTDGRVRVDLHGAVIDAPKKTAETFKPLS